MEYNVQNSAYQQQQDLWKLNCYNLLLFSYSIRQHCSLQLNMQKYMTALFLTAKHAKVYDSTVPYS